MLPGMPLLKFELSSMSSILQILKECLALSCINNCSMSLSFKLKQETHCSNSCQVIFGIPLLNFFFKAKTPIAFSALLLDVVMKNKLKSLSCKKVFLCIY